VAANFCVLGTGTDTGNSIRMPSGTSAVVGVLPTRGLVSIAGIHPLDWLLDDERKTMVRQALAKLPRRDAEVLLLKYSEDWSYRQMAEHLGMSTSAVEARLHRAREKLRRALHQMDPSLARTGTQ